MREQIILLNILLNILRRSFFFATKAMMKKMASVEIGMMPVEITRVMTRVEMMRVEMTRVMMVVTLVTALSACSIRPVRPSRQGLLERAPATSSHAMAPLDQGTALDPASLSPSSAGSTTASRKSANDLYALKAGGPLELKGEWQWPLSHVEISSPYGERGNKFHQGIDLHAPMRTPVFAASDGVVVYVGSKIRGYGRMIVLKHSGNYYTVYAHHSKNLVKMGKEIHKGELIAYSGRSGHSSGPHLHFELRQGTQSFDPEYVFNGYFKISATRRIASKSSLSHEFEE